MQVENVPRRDKEKQAHEKQILAAAEKIFCLKGYENASMDEIAREAQFTKRTVYQYFENKDELYFAVVLNGLKRLYSEIAEVNKRERTGYDKLERSCKTYEQFFYKNYNFMRVSHCWGQLHGKISENGRYKNELIQYNNTIVEHIGNIIEEGKDDGSIQPGIDSKKTALCLVFLITGFYHQLSAVGDHSAEFFSLEQKEISAYAVDLAIKPLKRSKTVTATRKGTA